LGVIKKERSTFGRKVFWVDSRYLRLIDVCIAQLVIQKKERSTFGRKVFWVGSRRVGYPHGGLRPFHQKSTINFRASRDAILVTLRLKFQPNSTERRSTFGRKVFWVDSRHLRLIDFCIAQLVIPKKKRSTFGRKVFWVGSRRASWL